MLKPPRRLEGVILFTNYFYENPFIPPAVKFAVKYLFPGSEVELSLRNCNCDVSSHNLAFQVSVSVVFDSSIVSVLVGGFVGGKFF